MNKKNRFCFQDIIWGKVYKLQFVLRVFMLSLLLASCVSVQPAITEFETGNKNITVDNLLKIKKGESTTNKIQEIFGEPDSIVSDTKHGTTTWVYLHSQTKQNSLEHAPLQIDQTQLEITFNEKDVVIEYTQTVSSRRKKNL